VQGGAGSCQGGYAAPAGASIWGGGSNSGTTYGAGGLGTVTYGSPNPNNGSDGVVVIEY
jgi:hypothetical protein